MIVLTSKNIISYNEFSKWILQKSIFKTIPLLWIYERFYTLKIPQTTDIFFMLVKHKRTFTIYNYYLNKKLEF